MIEHEFTFGTTPCLIRAEGMQASAFVMFDDGATLRPIADASGSAVEFHQIDGAMDSTGVAVNYLVKRFGQRGPARQWSIYTPVRRIDPEPYMESL